MYSIYHATYILLVGLISCLLRLQPNEADPRPLAIVKKVIRIIFSTIILLPVLLFIILIFPLLLCFALVNYSELRELIGIFREIMHLIAHNVHVFVGSQSTHDTQVNEHIESVICNLVAEYGIPSKSFDETLLKYVKETKDFPINVAFKEIAKKIMQDQRIQARLNQSDSMEFTKVLVEAVKEAKSSNSSLRVYRVDFFSRKIIDEIKEEKRGLVIKCLERIKQNNDTRHNLTLRQAINLVMTALEGNSTISDEERKGILIKHLLDIQTTYGNKEACFVGSFNKIIEILDHTHPSVVIPFGSDRAKEAAVYKAPVIVNELFKKQSENDKEIIKGCWGNDEKANDANKVYVKFLEEVKQEVKKRLDKEFTGISNYIEEDIVENLKYTKLLSSNLANTSTGYDRKQEMRKKYQIEVKDASEIRIDIR